MVLGRFNWCITKKNVFNVIFNPRAGATAMYVAKDLTEQEATKLTIELNILLDDTDNGNLLED